MRGQLLLTIIPPPRLLQPDSVFIVGTADLDIDVSGSPEVNLPGADVHVAAESQVSAAAPGVDISAPEPVPVEEEIVAVGAKQVESSFGFNMPGLEVNNSMRVHIL